MRLDELFVVKNGIASTPLEILANQEPGTVPFIRPASTQQRTVAGWVKKASVPKSSVYPKDSLFVSTNGEGSHTYSYVSRFEFVPNSDVSVLIPKRKMTIQEKVFYSRCITLNRYRFSYGRKPKGNRLKRLEVPAFAPEWVGSISVEEIGKENLATLSRRTATIAARKHPAMVGEKRVKLRELFYITYGNKLDLNKMSRSPAGIAFVARTSKSNGVVAHVSRVDGVDPYDAGLVTVALGGSVLTSSLQVEPFYTAQNVAVLEPRVPMCDEVLLFYCATIQKNAFRFNACGREANRFLRDLLVPAKSAIPSWAYGSLKRVVRYIDMQLNSESPVAPRRKRDGKQTSTNTKEPR